MPLPPAVKTFFHNAIVTCVIGIIGGGLISWGSSYFYFEKGYSQDLAKALEKGREEGRKQGVDQGLAAAKANEAEMIEKRYPGAIQQARELGLAEGQKAGLTEGQRIGFDGGLKAGRDAAVKEISYMFYAEKHWQIYGKKVSGVAAIADRLDKEPGSERLQKQLLSEAESLVSSAASLRDAYRDQGKSFNSVMDNLEAAVAAKDFQAMRVHARSLRGALETKGSLFIQANRAVIKVFDDLSNPPRVQ